jgi:hypothetical protein
MDILEMMAELDKIMLRFGNIEVRSGSAAITRLAVLPYAAIEASSNDQRPNMQMFVALLSRQDDPHKPLPLFG